MKNKKKGFTLVELIVVLAILAILAAMLVPALTGYIDKANEKKALAAARQYFIAAQSTVSDAYASNDDIGDINATVDDNGNVTVAIKFRTNGTLDATAKDNSKITWDDDYIKLSEMKKKDTAHFVITDQKITSATVVVSGKTATYSSTTDAWTLS